MIESLFKLQQVKESDFDNDRHMFYKYLSDAFGTGKTLKEYWKDM